MPTLLSYTLRYYLTRVRRTALTVFGIALGVSMVVSIALVNRHIVSAYDRLVNQVAGKASIQVQSSASGGIAQEWVDRVRQTPGVAAAAGIVTTTVPVLQDGKRAPLLLMGIDPVLDREVRDYEMANGNWLGDGSGREVVLAQAFADRHGLALEEELTLLTTKGRQSYRVVGILRPTGAGRANLGDFAVVALPTAQSDFDRQNKMDEIHVVVAEGQQVDAMQGRLEDLFANQAEVRRTADRGRDVEEMLGSLRLMLTMASGIALFCAAFTIFNNMSAGLQERRRESEWSWGPC